MRLARLAALILCLPAAVGGQQRPGVELRGGVIAPLGDFREGVVAGAELAPGPSFAVHLLIPRGARSTVLLGFAQHRLPCSGAACADAGPFVSTSWNVGARWALRTQGVSPWIRLAALFDRSEADFLEEGAPVRRASSFGLGGELGVGLRVPFGERSSFGPGVRFAALNPHFPGFGAIAMRYAVADLALVIGF